MEWSGGNTLNLDLTLAMAFLRHKQKMIVKLCTDFGRIRVTLPHAWEVLENINKLSANERQNYNYLLLSTRNVKNNSRQSKFETTTVRLSILFSAKEILLS